MPWATIQVFTIARCPQGKVLHVSISFRLMYSILPPSVANELRHQRPVPPRKFDSVTILFSGIVGFGDFCARNSDTAKAMKIVQLLNNCYTHFDKLIDPKKNPNVYKASYMYHKKLE